MAPLVARHWNAIYLDAGLFARIDALHDRRNELGLDAEALRVLERYHLDFVRAGAGLSTDDRARFGDIVERLAVLGTAFGQNVLADEQGTVLALSEAEVAGLPEFARAAAAETARARNLNAPYAATTARSSVEPILHFADDRAIREKVWRGFVKRGSNGNANDNRAVIAETIRLRAELAQLLGYPSYAHYKLADSMAGTPEAARTLLERVWEPGRQRAGEDREALQHLLAAAGEPFALEAWDWRYYAEKLRLARYDFDETEIKPYLELGSVIEAAFYTAGRLFGLSFEPRADIPVYHPDMKVWVVSRQGREIGVFYGDFFARPGKRSGAWMTSFRDQQKLGGAVMPLIINTSNFSEPPENDPALLSLDEARTVFHEFGHGLHGLLSDVTWPRLSGTSVVRDFVELPSQLFEHWLEQPPVLARLVPLSEWRADPAGPARPPAGRPESQQGLRDRRVRRLRHPRHGLSHRRTHRRRRRRCLRGGDAQPHRHATGNRRAARQQALPAHLLGGWVRRRLLQLSLVRGPRCRCFPRVRGGWRSVRPGNSVAALRLCLFCWWYAGFRSGLPPVPRTRS